MLIFAEFTIIFDLMSLEIPLLKLLAKRDKLGNTRKLGTFGNELIDFSSNDYLGLARSQALKDRIIKAYQNESTTNGSSGSRLLTGNSKRIEELESFLADLFGFQDALIFSSGYMANLALFSTVPQKGDTVLYDELSHACMKDGIRLSFAQKRSFRHNDLEDLSRKIEEAEGAVYVACEAVYSMDGDLAPLAEILSICQKHNAFLIIDEAHSTGIWGSKGQGLTHELDLQNAVFAVVNTFGKAMGVHGASISGSKTLKSFLINYARPFIYTTAPSDFEIMSIKAAFDYLSAQPNRQANLFFKIDLFNQITNMKSDSPIKTISIRGNQLTKKTALTLQKAGFDVRPILSPTVKAGSERLRICLHSFNSEEEISSLAERILALKP